MYNTDIAPVTESGIRVGLRNQILGVRVSPGAPNILPFVQWIGQHSSKVFMGVRFPHGGPVMRVW